MKKYLLIVFSALVFMNSVYATDWYDKKVNQLQINAANGCLYFTLEGVAQADSVTPGQPWFTLEPSNASHSAMLSILMLAYASKVPVKVTTTGVKTPVCGYSQVQYVRLQSN